MPDITLAEFETRALAQGFDEVLTREWAPGQVLVVTDSGYGLMLPRALVTEIPDDQR